MSDYIRKPQSKSDLPDSNRSDDGDTDDSILHEARESVSNWYNYFAPNYEMGRNDEYFLMHDQWSPDDRTDLLRLGIPILSTNKIQYIVKKVIGEMWEMDPQIQVRSLDYVPSKNDTDLLKIQNAIDIRQNLLRNIAYRSDSKQAYCHAFEQSVQRGYGAFRVDTRYKDSNSFDIEPDIIKIDIGEMAFFDPLAIQVHKGDGRYCGFYNLMSKKEFQRLYPNSPIPTSFPSFTYPTYFYWGDKECVSVVDMYRKEYFTKLIYKLSDNRVVDKDKYEELIEASKRMRQIPPEIIDEREADDFEVMHYRFTYNEVLEKNVFPAKFLPIFFVDRRSYKIDGRQYTKSFFRDAIDAQRQLNYLNVSIVQYIKNARRESYIATGAQIAGYEPMWMQPENQTGVLLYNPDGGNPPPSKQPPTEVPQSLYQHYQRVTADIQAVLGYYDANLGAPTDVISGKALNAKVRQGNLSTYIERANLISAIEQCGRCILSMIPQIYDTERTVMLTTPDKKHKNVIVNKLLPDGTLENNLKEGNFEVSVGVGASYEIQKEAALETLVQLVAGAPQIFPLVADLIAANVDVENQNQLIERLSTLVPAEIKAKERGEPPPPQQPPQPNPELIAQIGNLQLKQNDLQFKQQKMQTDAQLKIRDQQLEAARLQLEAQGQLSDNQANNLKSIAEIARAHADERISGHDVRISGHNVLTKMADLHKANKSKPQGNAM